MHPALIDTLVTRYRASHAMATLKTASFGEPEYYECAAVFPHTELPSTKLSAELFLANLGIRTRTVIVKGFIAMTWIMSTKMAREGVAA